MIDETFNYGDHSIRRELKIGLRTATSQIVLPRAVDRSLPAAHAWWQAMLRGGSVHAESVDVIRSIDLFCGVGGLTLGAVMATQAAGFRLVPAAAVDIDADALEVYRRNFRTTATKQTNAAAMIDYHVYGRGATAEMAYAPEILDSDLAIHKGSTDLLLAGPPCQGHSSLNNHTRRDDPRNQLYVSTAAIAIALEAKMIVIENVPEVTHDKADATGTAMKILQDAGYHVSQDILIATAFGGAQSRRRHFTIATMHKHESLGRLKVSLSRSPMNLVDAIGDLEHCQSMDIMDQLPNLSAENKQRIDYLFDNDLYELPDDIRPEAHKNGHSYPSVYGRLHWDSPSPTITTGFMTPGRGRYIHPSQRRVLTAREAARIQGFPDTFVFIGDGSVVSKKSLSKWIGDAVPTTLGYIAVLAALSGI